MRLTRLQLADFRSYPTLDLEFPPGVTVFLGRNGQGKTNIVEALGYLATLSSHRVPYDAALVRRGAQSALIHAVVERAGRSREIDLEIAPGRTNRARVQGAQLPRTRDLLGTVRAVLFAPEDLSLVKGDPEGRRRFLDELLVIIAPRYAALKADYDRVVKQRSALLKSMRSRRRGGRGGQVAGGLDPEESERITLGVWNDQLAELGAELQRARIHLATRLRPHLRYSYQRVAEDVAYEEALEVDPAARGEAISSPAQIRYVSATLEAHPVSEDPLLRELPSHEDLRRALLADIADKEEAELERAVCLVGPHRDDLAIELHDDPAKGYASHGESWSLALALRLAAFDLLRIEEGEIGDGEPILVLDDVFAELDGSRRERLAAILDGAGQVLVTTANDDDLPARLLREAHLIDVTAGHAEQRRG